MPESDVVAERLARWNLERIEHAYAAAMRCGVEEPVVLVLDVRRSEACELAAHLTGVERRDIHRFVERTADECVVPTIICAVPAEQLAHLMPTAPGPEGTFPVAVFVGSMRVRHLPIPTPSDA